MGRQHPCSMTPTSVCCRITDKHIGNHFSRVLRSLNGSCCHSLKSMHIIGTHVCRFKRVHLPCPCGQLFVRVFPPSPMLRYCCHLQPSRESGSTRTGAHMADHHPPNSPCPSSHRHATLPTIRTYQERWVANKNCSSTGRNPEPSFYGGPIKSAWGGTPYHFSAYNWNDVILTTLTLLLQMLRY